MAERLEGGIGIMADDIVAGGLAGMCLLAMQFALYAMQVFPFLKTEGMDDTNTCPANH